MLDINLQSKIADLLSAYPQLEDELINISPLFAKLQNPILRRTVAKVTSVQQAATIANMSAPLLVQQLREAAGLMNLDGELKTDDEVYAIENQPSWFSKEKIVHHYNATPVIESGNSPMQTILKLCDQLQIDEILQVSTPFRPAPIIEILQSRGYAVWSKEGENYICRK